MAYDNILQKAFLMHCSTWSVIDGWYTDSLNCSYGVYHSSVAFCSKKGKVLPYSLPSVKLGANPGVQAVSPQVTLSHPPGGRLPLLSARPAFIFPTEERNHPSASTKRYCLVTEAHGCEQLARGYYSTSSVAGARTRDH